MVFTLHFRPSHQRCNNHSISSENCYSYWYPKFPPPPSAWTHCWGVLGRWEDRACGYLELPGFPGASFFGVFDGHGGYQVRLALGLFGSFRRLKGVEKRSGVWTWEAFLDISSHSEWWIAWVSRQVAQLAAERMPRRIGDFGNWGVLTIGSFYFLNVYCVQLHSSFSFRWCICSFYILYRVFTSLINDLLAGSFSRCPSLGRFWSSKA